MKSRIAISICLLLFSATLVACQQETTASPPTNIELVEMQVTDQLSHAQTPESYMFKTAQPGTTSVHGLLIVTNPIGILPDPNDAIFLVPLDSGGEDPATIPSFVLGEVPQAEVDESNGEFIFTDIKPGLYAVMILALGGSQIPARTYKGRNLVIVKVEESDRGNIIELGDLSFP